MIKASIFDAKTQLSKYVKHVQSGEEVLLTSGRKRTPVAKLVAVKPRKTKRLGLLETPGFVLSEKFFKPLPEDELKLWNGEGE
jgi:antitoxin (DNA-binding transcriptional repressor) of toxin-antitoxin stability system